MKIAIVGYGRMGKLIERIARERGHQISCVIDRDNVADFDSPAFRSSDVAIDFSVPATGYDNVVACLDRGVPVVSGTTGWQQRLTEAEEHCRKVDGTMMWSSNFSLGVNLFFAINERVTSMLGNITAYTPYLTEVHHIHKLDHPSGTAVTLAEQIVEGTPRLDSWAEEPDKDGKCLVVNHVREGEVPGTHIIRWDSAVDAITLRHDAKSREGFALGAVMSAEWAASRKGVLNIRDFVDSLVK
ncbi:MAG: 4-hydroxy-tetrahydrodipicolinate reductase [Bacteroidales bacterium]|nr:4-hydroxy-tetrahydrodipicolinate reductase [Bacteroidales bacterium]